MNSSITVYIPTFNRADTLGRAIRSALAQKRFEPDVKILVLDDGSTDSTESVLKLYAEEIMAIRFGKNRGVGWVSKEALNNIETDYFMRLDSDDFLSEDCLRVLAPIAKGSNSSFDLISCNYVQVDENEFRSEVIDLSDDKNLYNFGAGMLFKTEVVKRAGGYNASLRTREDLDLHLRLGKAGVSRFHVPIPLYRRYVRTDNLSLSEDHASNKIRMIRDSK
jgi:glycosyltransferase involved in cell wall biosynthesis